MFRRFSTNFAILSIFLDTIFVALALVVANYLRPLLNILPFAAEIRNTRIPFLLYPVFALTWVAILLMLSLYDGRRHIYITDEFTTLTLGSLLAIVSLAGQLYLSYRDVSRLLFLAFVLIAYLALIFWRLLARIIFRMKNEHPQQNRRVLIIGAGPVGRELQQLIAQHPYFGLKIVGFLDDSLKKLGASQDIIGTLTNASAIVAESKIDDVVIALPRRAHEQVNRLVAKLHHMPVKVWVIPDYFHLALHKARIDEFAGIPMLDLRAPALNDYQRMVKRIFDLLAGTTTLILVSPLMALIAIAIKLDSPGPVLFKQRRVGENGRLFLMFKFRSMVIDADKKLKEVMHRDENGNIIHKTPHDPRITRIGHFIRRTSFDELPQLFNVLRGEMSLVGPRPEMPLLVEEYKPWQRKRFAVPQGITGWWQVNGRSDKPMHLNTEDDLYYVQNYSLLLDLQILLKTVLVVLNRKGAY